ncbi:uncharacterized protein LOC126742757 isoform X2 [Anthonomus grandis grandis]|uniref:uncharacterized protein LOC126742757 isoform X2 n=1 Tax=Anthonomus grandis grandis TaxID=2921223 RepID=UPI002164F101|nr:uncharacterized protein LOC126742757 isoform X2 [Anthonomus grandis grandis]
MHVFSGYQKFTEESIIKISSMYNRMNALHERYEKAQLECKKWDKIHKYGVLNTTEKLINTVAIKESCLKMYLEICQRKNTKPVHQNNVEMQLLAIKQAIGEYEIINKRVVEMKERDLRASIDPKVSSTAYNNI